MVLNSCIIYDKLIIIYSEICGGQRVIKLGVVDWKLWQFIRILRIF